MATRLHNNTLHCCQRSRARDDRFNVIVRPPLEKQYKQLQRSVVGLLNDGSPFPKLYITNNALTMLNWVAVGRPTISSNNKNITLQFLFDLSCFLIYFACLLNELFASSSPALDLFTCDTQLARSYGRRVCNFLVLCFLIMSCSPRYNFPVWNQKKPASCSTVRVTTIPEANF